jgi:hypothetical protein
VANKNKRTVKKTQKAIEQEETNQVVKRQRTSKKGKLSHATDEEPEQMLDAPEEMEPNEANDKDEDEEVDILLYVVKAHNDANSCVPITEFGEYYASLFYSNPIIIHTILITCKPRKYASLCTTASLFNMKTPTAEHATVSFLEEKLAKSFLFYVRVL